MIVRIAPAAERDIVAAYSWYENQKEGLGDGFIKSVDQAVERIGLYPQAYRNFYGYPTLQYRTLSIRALLSGQE